MPDDEMIFPPGVPEDFQEKIKQMIDKQKMASQVTRQSISRMFQELTQEQLQTLRLLFSNTTANPQAGAFYEGMCSGLLAQKFDQWPGWDDDGHMYNFSFDTNEDGTLEIEAEMVPVNPTMGPSDDENLEKYNVRRNPDDPTDKRVQCRNCEMLYVSLEDRMMRPADEGGCMGCIEKTKWGGNQ